MVERGYGPPEEGTPGPGAVLGMSKACASCGTVLSDDARQCSSCGEPVVAPATVEPPSPPAPPSAPVPPDGPDPSEVTRAALSPTCPVCGAAVLAGTRRCPNCGLALTSTGGVPASKPVAPSFGPANVRFGERPIVVEPFTPRPSGPERWPWPTIGLVAAGLVLVLGMLAAVVLLVGGSNGEGAQPVDAATEGDTVAGASTLGLRGTATTATSTIPASPSAESTSTTEAGVVVVQDDDTGQPDDLGCAGAAGPSAPAEVAGAERSVTLRDGPGRSATALDQVAVGTELVSFPESALEGDELWWVEVSVGGRCGWMAAQFLRDDEGQSLDPAAASSG